MAKLDTSIVDLIGAGTKIALLLTQLAANMKDDGHEARTIASEIRCLCSVLKTLHGTLSKVENSPYYAHCIEVMNDMADASLELFTDLISITKGLQVLAKSTDGKFGLRSKLYWSTFKKSKILTLRAALEAYKSNLSLMLGTMDVSEKVSRQLSLSLDDIAEDEQDSALLEGLHLDQQASIIEVANYEEELDPETEDMIPEVPMPSEPEASTIPTTAIRETVDQQLLDQVEDEVASLRSSRDSLYSRRSVSESVRQHSNRLSQLMSDDQSRISSRWSRTISSSARTSHLSQVSFSRFSHSWEPSSPVAISRKNTPRQQSNRFTDQSTSYSDVKGMSRTALEEEFIQLSLLVEETKSDVLSWRAKYEEINVDHRFLKSVHGRGFSLREPLDGHRNIVASDVEQSIHTQFRDEEPDAIILSIFDIVTRQVKGETMETAITTCLDIHGFDILRWKRFSISICAVSAEKDGNHALSLIDVNDGTEESELLRLCQETGGSCAILVKRLGSIAPGSTIRAPESSTLPIDPKQNPMDLPVVDVEKRNSGVVASPSSSASADETDDGSAGPFKSFRVSIDDPCHKVLPVALKKYNVLEEIGRAHV